jgi:chromosome segregation ATPase
MSASSKPSSQQSGQPSLYWTQEIVSSTCVALEKKGITPTISTVRAHLKQTKGSDSTVQKYIRGYRESPLDKTTQERQQSGANCPAEVSILAASLWEKAQQSAHALLSQQQMRVQADQQRIHEERLAMEGALAALEEKLAQQAELIARLEEEQRTLKEAHQSQAAQWQAERNELQEKNQTLNQKMSSLNNTLIERQSQLQQAEKTVSALEAHTTSLTAQQSQNRTILTLMQQNLQRAIRQLPDDYQPLFSDTMSAIFEGKAKADVDKG